jgi:hypothetical protein
MSSKIILKNSSTTGTAPGVNDLEYGEVALNYADGKLYFKNFENEIKHFSDTIPQQIYVSSTPPDDPYVGQLWFEI